MDFDEYADQYEQLLVDQHSLFASDRAFFHRRKVSEAVRRAPSRVNDVLDFGCGTGGGLRALRDAFPNANLFGFDPSRDSRDLAQSAVPSAKMLEPSELATSTFDLVFVSCVLHHVPQYQWVDEMFRLASLLRPTGLLFIFEHNPWNPVTRKMVRDCPFDADAVLLSRRELRNLAEQAGLCVDASGYMLFFPAWLGWLLPMESLLTWCPLGGQHFLAAKRCTA